MAASATPSPIFFQASSPEKASAERRAWEKDLARLIGRHLSHPRRRPFWLLGTDVVSIPRPFAQTLEDRVRAEQVVMLLQDGQQPFQKGLCVHVAYSAVEHLGRVGHLPNLVTVTRTAENQVFYRQREAGLRGIRSGSKRPPPRGGRPT